MLRSDGRCSADAGKGGRRGMVEVRSAGAVLMGGDGRRKEWNGVWRR